MILTINNIKEKRPNAGDYKAALLRLIESGADLINDKEAMKQYLFLNVKLISTARRNRPKDETYEDIQNRFTAFCLLTDMLGQLTPTEFLQMFPIKKTYNGKKYQCKDYFSTVEALKDYDPVQSIGEEGIMYFLWDYDNDDIVDFEVEKMCCMSDLRRAQGGLGLMEEFAQNEGIPTYTFHEKEGYMYNQLTGEATKVRKPKRRIPKFMKVVEGGERS